MGSQKSITFENNKGRHVTYRPHYVRPFEARYPTATERAIYITAAERINDEYQRLSLQKLVKIQHRLMAELLELNLEVES